MQRGRFNRRREVALQKVNGGNGVEQATGSDDGTGTTSCAQGGTQCVYPPPKKPGPKGPRIARATDTSSLGSPNRLRGQHGLPDRRRASSERGAKRPENSIPTSTLTLQGPYLSSSGMPPLGAFVRAIGPRFLGNEFSGVSAVVPHPFNGLNAMRQTPIEFTNVYDAYGHPYTVLERNDGFPGSAQRPPQSAEEISNLSSLPKLYRMVTVLDDLQVPDSTMTLVLNQYWTKMYPKTPALIRAGVLEQVSRLPAFVNDSCCFHAAYFLDASGQNALVPIFYERTMRTLAPAIERILSRQDISVLGDRTVCYNGIRELSIFAVFCLISLIVVCMAEKSTSEDPLADAHALLELAVRVAYTAGLNTEWRFGSGENLTPLLEMCRRCWWALFAIDRHISVLYGKAPLLDPDQCEVGFPMGDVEYEKRIEQNLISESLDLAFTGTAIVAPPRSQIAKVGWLTAPDKLPGPFGPIPFGPFEYYVALMCLYERVRWFRERASLAGLAPWADTTLRQGILQDLDSWFAGLPPFVKTCDENPASVGGGNAGLRAEGIACV